MPRPLINDALLVHRFHVLDISPSISIPPFVLWPSAAFTSVSAPEITAAVEDIQEGTSDFVHHVLSKASVNTITLNKGVSALNSDFWRWMVGAIRGNPTAGTDALSVAKTVLPFIGSTPKIPAKRRNLLLMHFAPFDVEGLISDLENPQNNAMSRIAGAGLLAVGGNVQALSQLISTATGGFASLGIEYVPAKVYMLIDCLPIRYKPASDFDAATSAVSIEELEISFGRMEEFALAA